LRLLEQFGIREMVRSGRMAMARGAIDGLTEDEKVLSGNGYAV